METDGKKLAAELVATMRADLCLAVKTLGAASSVLLDGAGVGGAKVEVAKMLYDAGLENLDAVLLEVRGRDYDGSGREKAPG